jgi:hypothetical protein
MITIITFTQNNALELNELANSISAVNHKNLEWYIKDSSTNNVDLRYLNSLKKEWRSKVKLVVDTTKDRSLYNAFNIACNNSIGNYLINFNPDDKLHSNSLRECLDNNNYEQYDITVFPLEVEGNVAEKQSRKFSGNIYHDGARSHLDGCATSLLFSKNIYKKFNGFDEMYLISSDLDFMLKICINIQKLKLHYAQKPIGIYGVEGLSSKINLQQIVEIHKIYRKHLGSLAGSRLALRALLGRIKTKYM